MNKYEMLLNVVESIEVENKDIMIEFLQHEMELLAKKNSSSSGDRKPTKVQIENLELIEQIEFTLSDNIAKTISDIQSENEELKELSNQKMSALLKKLVDSGKVTKFIEKKKTYFQIVVE